MARPSTAAALLLLALSLLAVAHCRPIEAEPAESNAVVVAVSDENGAAENPGLPAEAGASDTKVTVVPAVEEQEQQQQGGFLRLPSQGHRHPCRHGLHHRWARHHGVLGDAPSRFRSRHGEERLAVVLPAEAEEEVKAVAEPDPDRSLTESDGEGELPGTVRSFGDVDGARDAGDEGAAAVRAWKKEMLRRWVHLHAQSHHGMLHHRLHQGEQAAEDQVAVAGEGLKRFHHRRHHDDDEEEDEEKEKEKRKRFHPAEHHDDDSDDDEEVEEMVRRFRKAVTRRSRFGHSRRFHHHHHGHHHGEEAEKPEAGEEGGVVTWIKGLMNRF